MLFQRLGRNDVKDGFKKETMQKKNLNTNQVLYAIKRNYAEKEFLYNALFSGCVGPHGQRRSGGLDHRGAQQGPGPRQDGQGHQQVSLQHVQEGGLW